MRPEPRPYERYRHFKGRDYQVLLIATDAGSGRKSVVYQGLYEPFRIYVRDMEEFLSDVDRGKYPYAQQKERFVLIENASEDEGAKGISKDIHIDTPADKKTDTAGKETDGEVKKENGVKAEAPQKPEKHSENAEKLSLFHKTEGKSIFKKKDGAERTEDNTIRVVDPSVKKHAEEPADPEDKEQEAVTEGGEQAGASAVDPSLTKFLDADTVEKKLDVLQKERNRLTPKTLMLIELSLGLEVQDGDIEDRYYRIRNNLQTRQKYERHRPG